MSASASPWSFARRTLRLVRAGLLAAGLTALPQAQAAPQQAEATPGNDVYVYHSPSTEAFFTSIGGNYGLILDVWRLAAPRLGFTWREVNLAQLDRLPEGAIVVLPSAVGLDDRERRAIDRHARRGGALLATWATGARDGNGGWRGYDFVADHFAARVTGELSRKQEGWFLLPHGETPVTTDLPAGLRISLTQVHEGPLRAVAARPAGRYSDWARRSLPQDGGHDAVALRERDGFRGVWLGFSETSWSAAQPQIETLVTASLAWLRRTPMAAKENWPVPYRAAILLEMDTEDKFENAELFARHLDDRKLRGTFYSLTSYFAKVPDVARRLSARHEIAFHGDVHDAFKGSSLPEQEARFIRMFADTRRILPNVNPTGFRAPMELFDHGTEIAARRHGIRHHVVDGNGAHALPVFSNSEPSIDNEQRIVMIPRTWYDDINLMRQEGSLAGFASLFEMLVTDAITMRSLGLMSIHSQHFERDGDLDRAIPLLLDSIVEHRDAVWVATGGDIERWWRDRDRVGLKVLQSSATGMRLRVDVRNPVAAGIGVVISPPDARTPAAIRFTSLGDARLIRRDDQQWTLKLPALKAGSHQIDIEFGPGSSPADQSGLSAGTSLSGT